MAKGIDWNEVRQTAGIPGFISDEQLQAAFAKGGITTQADAMKWAGAQGQKSAGGLSGFIENNVTGPAGHWVQNLSNLVNNDVYGPLGTAESGVAHTLAPGMFPSSGGSGGPGPATQPAHHHAAAPTTVQVPFDLGSEINAASAPYYAQMAQAAQAGVPGGLGQYLNSHVPALTDLALGAAAQHLQQAEAAAPGAYQAAAGGAADAGRLQDYLNAVRYMDVYKQGQFGAPNPKTNPLLAQLYGAIQQGQQGTFKTTFPQGTSTGGLPTGTQSPTSPFGATNPFSSTPAPKL